MLGGVFMKKLICVLLLFSISFCFSTAYADSLISNIEIKDNQSTEYQTFYLASLCAINIIRNGDNLENIEMVRAVCNQINVPSKEKITCGYKNHAISIDIEINFDDLIFIQLSSEYIDIEKTLPFLKTSSFAQQSEDHLQIRYYQNDYSISCEDFLSLFDHIPTRRAIIVIPSPYQSVELDDAKIILFDTYDVSNQFIESEDIIIIPF